MSCIWCKLRALNHRRERDHIPWEVYRKMKEKIIAEDRLEKEMEKREVK